MLATIILMVKPVEAAFACDLYKTSPQETLAFLFTHNGANVDPLKMTSIMGDTLRHYGLETNMAELRHALDAFAHKLGKPGWQLRDPVLSRMANHNGASSAGYGRDQFCFAKIPADLSEANAER